MKRKLLPVLLQVTVIILLNVCLAGNLAGIFGDSWFTFKGKTSFSLHQISYGILRQCRRDNGGLEKCVFRKNIFEFKYLTALEEIIPDVMFVLLLLSSCCCFIGVSCCLMLHRCHDNKNHWRCGSATSAVFSLLAALSNVVVVLYGQIAGDHLNGYKQDWTAIVAWSTTIAQILCTVLTFILIFINPTTQRKQYTENNMQSSTNYSVTRYWYSSNPFEYYRKRFQHRLPSDSSGANIAVGSNNTGFIDGYEMRH